MIYLLVGRAKTMAMLSNLMFFDQMTGISNETGLTRYMGMTLAQGRFAEHCSNFLNIKNMKLINSRYSDDAGDAVMLGYAKALDTFVKERDIGIAARLGGDNFLVFVEKKFEDEFIEFVKNIEISYKKPSGIEVNIKVESRVGMYFIKPGDGINEAMRSADVASKLARNTNYPDYVKFEDSMMTHIIKMRQLEMNIPIAIEKKEFVVYYQPKVDISTEGIYVLNGAEALVRWVKAGEMVSPGEFIPVLEKSGLVSL